MVHVLPIQFQSDKIVVKVLEIVDHMEDNSSFIYIGVLAKTFMCTFVSMLIINKCFCSKRTVIIKLTRLRIKYRNFMDVYTFKPCFLVISGTQNFLKTYPRILDKEVKIRLKERVPFRQAYGTGC